MVLLLISCFDYRKFQPVYIKQTTRRKWSVYDYRIEIKDINAHVDSNTFLINMIRDPRAVILSVHPDHGRCNTFDEWICRINYIENLKITKKFNILNVKFEELIIKPEQVENQISTYINETSMRSFKDFNISYLNNIDLIDIQKIGREANGIRSLDPQVLYFDKTHPLITKNDLIIKLYLQRHGYEPIT